MKIERMYYYLHTNGKIISKRAIVAEMGTTPAEYFDSPFVKKYWLVKDEKSRNKFIEEVNELNLPVESLKTLMDGV